MEMDRHQVLLESTSKIKCSILGIIIIMSFLLINMCFNNILTLKFTALILIMLNSFFLYKKAGFFHPITILFGLFCFFDYNRIIFDILGLIKFEDGNFFDIKKSTINSQILSIKIFNYSLIAWYIGIMKNLKKNEKFLNTNINLYKISDFLFKVVIIVSFFFLYIEVREVLKNGYMSIYLNMNSRNIFQKIILGSPFVLYCINLSTGYKKKIFFENTVLFLIFLFLEILKGARGNTLVSIFTIIIYYYYSIKNDTKISLLKISLLLCSFTLISIIIGNFRSHLNLLNGKILKQILDFFTSQTITASIVTKAVEYKYLLVNKVNIFTPWTKEAFYYNELTTKNFGTIISRTLNMEMFKNGFGLGGNPIAELYIYLNNQFLFFIIMYVYIYIIMKFVYFCKYNWISLSFFLFFLPKLLFMPRANFIFINILDVIKYLLVMSFVIIINFVCKNRRKSDKD